MKQEASIEKHVFIPRWDEHEKGYSCTVCGVLKEEHQQFEIPVEPKKPS